MRRGLARRDMRRFPRRLALVAAHAAHLAGNPLVQPAQAFVLREQLRSVRGFVEEGIAGRIFFGNLTGRIAFRIESCYNSCRRGRFVLGIGRIV